MSGLPREILKWLQSLDLSYSIKNPKRDFSNGFLVAEIVSRYWKGVQMHSFDNGTGVVKKRDNWEQLIRIFHSKSLVMSSDLVEGVILCREGAAVQMIAQVYTFLTSRKIQFIPPHEHEEVKVPAFQKNTASKLLRDQSSAPHVETVIGDQDARKKEERAQALLKEHQEAQQREKIEDPGRFKAKPKVQAMQAMRPPDEIPDALQGVAVNFKEVKVKTIDSATALRSVRAQQLEQNEVSSDGDLGLGGAGGGSIEDNVVVLMNRAVHECLKDLGITVQFGEKEVKSYIRYFTSNLEFLDADIKGRVWRALSSKAESLGNAVFARPGELAKLAASMHFLWDKQLNCCGTPPDSSDCDEAVTLLNVVGDEVTRRDSNTAWAAFRTHLLPWCTRALVQGVAVQRWTVISLMQHWFRSYEVSELIEVVRVLQRTLSPNSPIPLVLNDESKPPSGSNGRNTGDGASFILTLAAIAGSGEKPLPELEEVLLYYARQGLLSTQPLSRAASLFILERLLVEGSGGIAERVLSEALPLVARLCSAYGETGSVEHWEVLAAALSFGSVGLDVVMEHRRLLDEQAETRLSSGFVADDVEPSLFGILGGVISERIPLHARQIGISVAGRHAVPTRLEVGRAIVRVVLRLPSDQRQYHLRAPQDAEAVFIPSRVRVSYQPLPASREWNAVGVALAASELLAKSKGEGGTGSFSLKEILELLSIAVVSNDAVAVSEGDVQGWWNVVLNAHEDLCKGMQDEALRDVCEQTVLKLFFDLSGEKCHDEEPQSARQERAVKWFTEIPLASIATDLGAGTESPA